MSTATVLLVDAEADAATMMAAAPARTISFLIPAPLPCALPAEVHARCIAPAVHVTRPGLRGRQRDAVRAVAAMVRRLEEAPRVRTEPVALDRHPADLREPLQVHDV